MLSEFIAFIKRGNIVDLAVAVVIGTAFGAVVTSLVDDIINPIIAAVVGKPDMSDMVINVGDAAIKYGSFLTAIINFLIIAAAIFFLVIKPITAMQSRFEKATADTTKVCPECLSLIPVEARRCAFCGQLQATDAER